MEPPSKRAKFGGDTAADAPEEKSDYPFIFYLDEANLETVKRGNDFQLLNCDDHQNVLKKMKKDPAESRPDICHQMLLALLDSPLNKAGKMKVYVRTSKNVLIDVHPSLRIPRTYKRFAGLMVQLLHKFSIRATNGPHKLLKIIKNPIESHLPVGCKIVGMSSKAELVNVRKYIKELPKGKTVVFMLGAFAHGKIDTSLIQESISVSQYPLSGACAISRLCHGIEDVYSIL